jgi:hypothetical protein
MSSELARQVSMLPAAFAQSDKSTARLLRDAAQPDALCDLSEAQIAQVLRDDPKLIDLWFLRGADQRLSGGWGVEGANSDFRVQRLSDGTCLHFQDRVEACAAFVVRYVSFIVRASVHH